ncbi:MAG: hypothetical protein JEZ02_20725 [Desulfatibacillum sp.]|nr:hypothetical protein [Desulfatibacillum sp.]
MENSLPEKARLLALLRQGGFNVPDFIYIPARDFEENNFKNLEDFLGKFSDDFKVIARSAHPMEEFYKGGTFDSLETYADTGGIKYARNRIIKSARQAKKLAIMRQQIFNSAPELKLEEMGVIVMPFISGASIMAKMVGDHWEFGYSMDRTHKVQRDPYITNTPHDIKLLHMSQEIQAFLGFRCEIEFIVSPTGEVFVVQAKDISAIDTRAFKDSETHIKLDGVRRIRRRRNYRERPLFVMDNNAFYMDVIAKCEDIVLGRDDGHTTTIEDILSLIRGYERDMEEFAIWHERYAVLRLSTRDPKELYQVANHYLDDFPEIHAQLAKALHTNLYQMDYFLAEADTLIAKDKFRINLCSHDAYGIDTLRNPVWSVFWNMDRHEEAIASFVRLGFKTGDTIAVEINPDEKPSIHKL